MRSHTMYKRNGSGERSEITRPLRKIQKAALHSWSAPSGQSWTGRGPKQRESNCTADECSCLLEVKDFVVEAEIVVKRDFAGKIDELLRTAHHHHRVGAAGHTIRHTMQIGPPYKERSMSNEDDCDTACDVQRPRGTYYARCAPTHQFACSLR